MPTALEATLSPELFYIIGCKDFCVILWTVVVTRTNTGPLRSKVVHARPLLTSVHLRSWLLRTDVAPLPTLRMDGLT